MMQMHLNVPSITALLSAVALCPSYCHYYSTLESDLIENYCSMSSIALFAFVSNGQFVIRICYSWIVSSTLVPTFYVSHLCKIISFKNYLKMFWCVIFPLSSLKILSFAFLKFLLCVINECAGYCMAYNSPSVVPEPQNVYMSINI